MVLFGDANGLGDHYYQPNVRAIARAADSPLNEIGNTNAFKDADQ